MEEKDTTQLITEADSLYSAGRLREALLAYQEALEQDDTLAWAHNRIGAIRAQQGDLEAAEASFKHALELNPDLPQAHSNLGNLLFSRGKYQEALEKYQAAVKLNPDNPLFHENLHAALKKLGRMTEAIKALKLAHRLNRDQAKTDAKERLDTMRTRAKGRFGCLGVMSITLLISALASLMILV